MEYKFNFLDSTYGIHKIITGLVTNVYKDQIKIKCFDLKKDMVDCNKCHNRNNCDKAGSHILPPIPTCNCILNPPDISKYSEPKTYFIPIENIMDVSYIQSTNPDGAIKPKKGTKVMLLGISATVVKAIIIKLEFFDDNSEEAVKYVEIEKDKVYDFVHKCDGSILECRAKVVSIEECECNNTTISNSIVRENIGFDNSVYRIPHNKDNFMKEPPVRKIKITVDISESFNGNFEVIELDSIIDCTLIEDEDNTPNN